MKKSQPVVKRSSALKTFFFVSLGLLLLGTACLIFFVKLDRTIKTASGKVVETYSQKEFASRKQTVDREYEIIRYTVQGKEYTGKSAVPRTGESQYVPVFYYEKFPDMAWYYKKENSNVVFSSLFVVLSALAFFYALYRIGIRPKAQTAPASKKVQPNGKK
jgi:hypothetical protein